MALAIFTTAPLVFRGASAGDPPTLGQNDVAVCFSTVDVINFGVRFFRIDCVHHVPDARKFNDF